MSSRQLFLTSFDDGYDSDCTKHKFRPETGGSYVHIFLFLYPLFRMFNNTDFDKLIKYRVIQNDCRGVNNLSHNTPRSPDASSGDFFLWGYVKDQLNKDRPT